MIGITGLVIGIMVGILGVLLVPAKYTTFTAINGVVTHMKTYPVPPVQGSYL